MVDVVFRVYRGHGFGGRMLLDLRQLRTPAPVRGIRRVKLNRDGSAVVRDPANITGIVLHQTACNFKAKRGEERYMRALGVACHALAFKTGEAVLAAPFTWHVNHGNEFNATTLGLEVEGHYPGLPGRGPGKDTLLASTLLAADEALDAMIAEARREGIHLRYLYAHRQSSVTRRADPGYEIWQALAPKAARWGLEVRPCVVFGGGRAIPEEWGTACGVRY